MDSRPKRVILLLIFAFSLVGFFLSACAPPARPNVRPKVQQGKATWLDSGSQANAVTSSSSRAKRYNYPDIALAPAIDSGVVTEAPSGSGQIDSSGSTGNGASTVQGSSIQTQIADTQTSTNSATTDNSPTVSSRELPVPQPTSPPVPSQTRPNINVERPQVFPPKPPVVGSTASVTSGPIAQIPVAPIVKIPNGPTKHVVPEPVPPVVVAPTKRIVQPEAPQGTVGSRISPPNVKLPTGSGRIVSEPTEPAVNTPTRKTAPLDPPKKGLDVKIAQPSTKIPEPQFTGPKLTPEDYKAKDIQIDFQRMAKDLGLTPPPPPNIADIPRNKPKKPKFQRPEPKLKDAPTTKEPSIADAPDVTLPAAPTSTEQTAEEKPVSPAGALTVKAAFDQLEQAHQNRQPYNTTLVKQWVDAYFTEDTIVPTTVISIAGHELVMKDQPQKLINSLKSLAVTRGRAEVPFKFIGKKLVNGKEVEYTEWKKVEIFIGADWLEQVYDLSFTDLQGQKCSSVICVLANIYGQSTEDDVKFGFAQDARYNVMAAYETLFIFLKYGYPLRALTPYVLTKYSDEALEKSFTNIITSTREKFRKNAGEAESDSARYKKTMKLFSPNEIRQMARTLWDLPEVYYKLRTVFSVYMFNSDELPTESGLISANHFTEGIEGGSVFFLKTEPVKKSIRQSIACNKFERELTDQEVKEFYPDLFDQAGFDFRKIVTHEFTHALDAAYRFVDENNILVPGLSERPEWLAISGWSQIESVPELSGIPKQDILRLVRFFEYPEGVYASSSAKTYPSDWVLASDTKQDVFESTPCPAGKVCLANVGIGEFMRSYGLNSPIEDLAVTAELYYTFGESEKEKMPNKYKYVQANIFGRWTYSDSNQFALTLNERKTQLASKKRADYSFCSQKWTASR